MVYVIFFNQEILSLLEALWLPKEIVIVHYKQHQKGQSTKGPMNQDSRVGQPEGSPRTRFGCHAQIWIASAPKLHIGKKSRGKWEILTRGKWMGVLARCETHIPCCYWKTNVHQIPPSYSPTRIQNYWVTQALILYPSAIQSHGRHCVQMYQLCTYEPQRRKKIPERNLDLRKHPQRT